MAENKPNIKTILLIIAGIVGYILIISVLSPYIKKNKKETVENKVVYIPSDITKKYPNDFRDKEELIKRIRESVSQQYNYTSGDKEEHIYKDSKGRVVYKTSEASEADKSFLGGKGGYSYRRFFPDEEGYLYDKSGKVIKKVEIKGSYETSYYVYSEMDNKRMSYMKDGATGGTLRIITISYDEKGNKIKEERVRAENAYEKEITEFSNGKKKKEKKIIDYEVEYENINKIYVEITKEYDENEKLIKKFVLRKNKFNAVRSETNFDFIKGEIVTKYYDGEKAFATVTETLIGKDRAIVKRERVGDEFVIWDCFTYGKEDKFDRYIVTSNQVILYHFKECKSNWEWQYNKDKIGINKNSSNYENIKDEDLTEISELGDYDKYVYDNEKNTYTIIENTFIPPKLENGCEWLKGGSLISEFKEGIINSLFEGKVKSKINSRIKRENLRYDEVKFNIKK
jgi:hypothetical protein